MAPPSARPWLYGLLDPCLLALLAAGPDYGYSLTVRLAAVGFPDVPGGTIYPALLRLERRGLLDSTWETSTEGPRRKRYQVTPSGRDALAEAGREWLRLRGGLDALLGGSTPPLVPAADPAPAPAEAGTGT